MARVANPSEITQILYDKIQDSGWQSIMRSYMRSYEFEKVFEYLLNEVKEGDRFTPPVRYLMEPFVHCNYSDLKVVFIADSPYNAINVANGLAFSHPISLSKELGLRVLHNKISTEVYNNKPVSDFNTDLRVWAEQGILLLNSSFTTKINGSCKHYDVWKPFISHMLDMLNSENEDIVYVLFGTNAQHFTDLIDPDDNLVIEVDDPGKESYKWNSQNIFNRINEHLETIGKEKIVW